MNSDRCAGGAALDKGLSLLLAVVQSEGTPLSELAAHAGIPGSTAQRMVGVFLRQGFVSRTGRGHYAAGLRLAELAAIQDPNRVLAGASRPLLRQLSQTLSTTVHLGVLEGDMVSYLVKERGGGPVLRTREANQLEAYCTGIGKVLLAALDAGARDRYLAAGPFVRLTRNTITDPADLRTALSHVEAAGYATDRAEFEDGLYCLAVPVRGPGGRAVAAISASSRADHCDDPRWRAELLRFAARVGQRLGCIVAPRLR